MNFSLIALLVAVAVMAVVCAADEPCPTCEVCPDAAKTDATSIRRRIAVNASRGRTNVQISAINGKRKQKISGAPESAPTCAVCSPCPGGDGTDLRN
ncbi:hypothetical protein BV898_10798 [Hypsibius exemplaris]|uniref:Uncharacterized protein n=1 Tax=Hypsibius exemplaris TaxID=2072580 RepID=A0A1W0WIN0_HYPEX|nr:hypothetical protein BV898_10798 [Hypsibius exemplaris]